MTSKSEARTGAFIAQLLAPIPAADEQADTKRFRADMTRDFRIAWDASMKRVADAIGERERAWHRFKAAEGTAAERVAYFAYGFALENVAPSYFAQLLIPAPTQSEMRWKRRILGEFKQCDAEETRVAYARDEARLGALPAARRKSAVNRGGAPHA